MIRSDLALAALASAAVPGMRPVSVAAIRTGEDNPLHQTALVEDVTGRRWVIRAPLGAAAGAELERNDDLVRQLGKHLPFKVPAAAGYADLGQDGRAAIYPYVEGRALSLRHLPPGPGLASALGRAIAAVHNMPRELFEEHAVPVFDAAQFRARQLAGLDRAAETGHVPNGLLARWEQALEAPAMWEFATVPTHGSLDGDSFLVVFSDDADAASGRVVGLTGWERAQVADPAEDFAALVEQANPRAVDAVFESYAMARSQRPDGYLLNRARLASELRLITGLAGAVGRDDESFVRARADELRKLDRLTANDDSLVPRTALQPRGPAAVTAHDAPAGGPVGAADPAFPADELAVPADELAVPADDPDTTAPVPRLNAEGAVVPGSQPSGDSPDSAASSVLAGSSPGVTANAASAQDDEPAEDDEPAFVVESPAEGVHLEPAHPSRAHAAERVHAPDDGGDAVSAPGGEVAEVAEVVDVDPERPEVNAADGDAADVPAAEAGAGEVDSADPPKTPTSEAPDQDESPTEPDIVADTAAVDAPVSAANVTAPVPMFRAVQAVPEAREASEEDTDGAAISEPDAAPADDPESLESVASADQAEVDREAEERLHTLYGMPMADEHEPGGDEPGDSR